MDQSADGPTPGIGLRVAGLLPLTFGVYLCITVAARARHTEALLRELGVTHLPWSTGALFGLVNSGGVWILALALGAAGALYWVKASRRYASLVWFHSLVLLLYLGIHAFSTSALQEPIDEMVRQLAR